MDGTLPVIRRIKLVAIGEDDEMEIIIAWTENEKLGGFGSLCDKGLA